MDGERVKLVKPRKMIVHYRKRQMVIKFSYTSLIAKF